MKTKIKQTMDRPIYKSGLLLLAAVFLSAAALTAEEVTKEFHKQYRAGTGTTLDINNRYGHVIVETSNSDQIQIDVKVTVDFPGRERAEKLLSYIEVQFSESGDVVSAKTVIDDRFSFSGWGGGSRRFSIDYNIKMPDDINFTLANRYGDSDLEEIKGLVKLDIKYGNLKADNLSRGNKKPINYLSLAYGKAEIGSAGWLDVVLRYSGNFAIDKAQALLLDSKYSKIQIRDISSVVGNCKYDNIRIEKINNLVLDAGYADVNIGELSKKLKFDGGYGSVTVDRIEKGFESIESQTKYISVRLGIDPGASYKLDANLSYGDLKFDEDNFHNERRIVQNNSTEISGFFGNETSPSSTVKVTSSYGTVRLN
jgi:hypothetical protein